MPSSKQSWSSCARVSTPPRARESRGGLLQGHGAARRGQQQRQEVEALAGQAMVPRHERRSDEAKGESQGSQGSQGHTAVPLMWQKLLPRSVERL